MPVCSMSSKTSESVNQNSAASQRQGKENFYTTAIVKPRKKNPVDFEVKRVLIDPGATLNLMSLRMIHKIDYITYEDNSMTIKVANGAYQKLLGYFRFRAEVAEARKIIEAFIVPENTSYSLILGRPWLRSVKAIGFYEDDEYWIQDQYGQHHQLEVSGKATIKAPEIYLVEDVNPLELKIDEEILVDLDYFEEERA